VTEPIPAPEAPRYRWYHVVAALIFIVFCMELGMFLVIFPWSEFWDRSFFFSLAPEWRLYWDNAYLRGAVSGLGIVNVYIALVEIFRLRRFARR
jgi:quinol-cytochrome oxidoreductase complex cytochrome b subunit